MTTTMSTYGEHWKDPINETYGGEYVMAFHNNIDHNPDVVKVALDKAARALREGETVSLNGEELDAIRHLMPAHEIHQSYTRRFYNELFPATDSVRAAEARVRRVARAKGLSLVKSRTRNPAARDYGTYGVVRVTNPSGNWRSRELVAGDSETGCGLSLEEAAEWIEEL
ncbi:hypothetical protein [Mycobacteroides abscessus]|uniref:hypothetical protein n=1 Tax=Mycobacteroides abscessus TaxID=36809 RepID=UPI0009C6ED7B|nr:hypothetical protein [Mycobacteroides abscessus]SKS04702.1 Uncharacterised protein [Mycobacteroides abscessus subsp. abscessus]SKS16602.1 Uncharacterised protein [Mycobacteroides abscessus subsp. abscessus]